jgi:hypothetical protein
MNFNDFSAAALWASYDFLEWRDMGYNAFPGNGIG